MKRFIILLAVSLSLNALSIPSSARQFEYPANNEKSFANENVFYQQMNKKDYIEYKDAAYSVRKKMSYKEIPDALLTFEKKTGNYVGQPKQELATSIHPDRQVYFLASFVQTQNKEYWKHTIIDAETQRPLEGGISYHSYENPYR
ncbi:hypothetical protein CN378_03110 [Bacillus sp. AFS015802]|uniref:hypothetical protein n=1 Tax=Bacillus sp. AFS015802 TaxID=2033486 RepID=UPI000BF9810E|nr:hypothetical protein [Bacillus sp. AFS015802]PFA69770.1 hypothetical protein CN378_03110 [Bacillus sp. AFS015802]